MATVRIYPSLTPGLTSLLTCSWRIRILFILVTGWTILALVLRLLETPSPKTSSVQNLLDWRPIRPELMHLSGKEPDPIKWLAENSNDKHVVTGGQFRYKPTGGSQRPRAALISLVRNSELKGLIQSMEQLELRWNRRYQVGESLQVNYIPL